MTADTQTSQYYDDVIDLRAYVLVLARFWPVIVGMVFVAVVAAAGYALSRPTMYEATASVVITESRAELSLVPEFKTTTEGLPTNAEARRTALIGLVQNPTIATAVISQLGDTLPEELRDVSRLLESVEGASTGSDLIAITVHAQEPALAAAIVNAWALEFERHINLLYGVVVESNEAIQQQAERARNDYDAAQAALITFTSSNRIKELETEILDTEQVITTTAKAQTESRVATFSQDHAEQLETLGSLHDTRMRLTRLLADARALEAQVTTGGEGGAGTNALALMLLKAQAYAASSGMPANLQLQVASPTEASPIAQAADVRALVTTLEARIADLDASIAAWQEAESEKAVGALLDDDSTLDPTLASLQERLRTLQSQREAEQATLRELTQARDLAWETYTTVARKVAETNVGTALQGTVVRFAAPAATPTEAVSRGLVKSAALAGAVAFVLAVGIAFFANLLNPGIDPSRAIRGRRTSSAA